MSGFGPILAGGVSAQILSTQAVSQVAAGNNHTLFVESDGSLWGTGDNSDDGQLGNTPQGGSPFPVEIVVPAPPGLAIILPAVRLAVRLQPCTAGIVERRLSRAGQRERPEHSHQSHVQPGAVLSVEPVIESIYL